jgi:hypothetical protein
VGLGIDADDDCAAFQWNNSMRNFSQKIQIMGGNDDGNSQSLADGLE